jgi:hypothetical protein
MFLAKEFLATKQQNIQPDCFQKKRLYPTWMSTNKMSNEALIFQLFRGISTRLSPNHLTLDFHQKWMNAFSIPPTELISKMLQTRRHPTAFIQLINT